MKIYLRKEIFIVPNQLLALFHHRQHDPNLVSHYDQKVLTLRIFFISDSSLLIKPALKVSSSALLPPPLVSDLDSW